MKLKLVLFTMFAALVLWAGGQAQAQAQAVQVTQAPNVQVSGNSATVTWSTNVPSSAVVKYGTDRNNLSQTAQAAWGGAQHTVQLQNLQPGTYYYQVVSGEGQGTGTGALSAIGQFSVGNGSAANTTSAANTNGPSLSGTSQILAGPVGQKVTDNSLQIWWQTNDSRPSVVKYGTDPNSLTQTAQGAEGSSHYVSLTGLQPNTNYYYAVVDPSGKQLAVSTIQTLSPQQLSAQSKQIKITDGPYIERLSPTEAVVSWSTDRQSNSVVQYGTDQHNLNQKAEAPWGGTTHRVTVNKLQPDTQYVFEVQTAQAQGTGAQAHSPAFFVHTLKQGEQAMVIQPK